jgi:hypothetical protein
MSKPKIAQTVEMWDVEKIIPYAKNAKHHTPGQVEALAAVISSQGWDVPIVVDSDGSIIKGHGRRLAAIHLGLQQVPVICRRDLTPAQVKAARLSDNRVALGEFDVDLIKEELSALKDEGFDMGSVGFDEKEITMMLGELDQMQLDQLDDAGSTSEPKPPTDEISEIQEKVRKQKPLPITDILGFKHIPAEYRDVLVEFQKYAEEATQDVGAIAFGKMCKSLMSAER